MRFSLVGAIMLGCFCASSATAQSRPQTRDGFTISVGAGAGSAGSTCDGCDSDRDWAPAGYLRLGGAYRANLILGAEINGWSKTIEEQGDKATLTVATINAIAQWYPQPTGGFFIDGGLGIGSMRVEFTTPGIPTLSDKTTGLGYQVGAGYDIRLGKNFSLTPYATYFATAGGKVKSTDEKLDANVFQIGLGLTWH
jgi:opacity protein-like surface antigen